MGSTTGLADVGPLLERHQRAVLHHLCREIERSGHPEDVRTAHWLEQLEADIALRVFRTLYSPQLRRGAIEALDHIRTARRRLERGIYDICDHCGVKLSQEWLRQHPAALQCAGCLARKKLLAI